MYGGDNDDAMAPGGYTGPGTGTTYWWGYVEGKTLDETRGPLYPYTKSKGIQADPAFDNRLRSVMGSTGFAYNSAYLGPIDYPAPTYAPQILKAVPFTAVGSPAETVGFATGARINTFDYTTPTLEANSFLSPPSEEYPSFHGRHNGFGIVLWVDGHANARKPVLRQGSFGYGYDGATFAKQNLGEIDGDGDLTTDDLFDLN